jgi:integrase
MAVRNENGLLVKRRQKFPIRVEKNGVTVPVYRVRSGNGYTSFVISYRVNGTRKKLGFQTVAQARRAAKKAAGHIACGEVEAVKLKAEDGHAYLRAVEVLRPFGVQVDSAAREYAEALKLLGNRGTILEAIRHFSRSLSVVAAEKEVQEVVDELIQTREKDGSSLRHIDDLRSRLDRFAESVKCKMAEVNAARIHDFLLSLELAPRTVNNFRTSISNLITFARMKSYIPAGSDPLRDVPEVKEPHREVGIYTPREVERMISKASPKFLPYVVIGAFAGLRQSELERLDWVDVGEKYIRIRGAERRTKSTRIVEIQPNLREWLKTLRQPRGRVVPFDNVCNPLTRLVKKAEVEQKHNGLRHSYGSYRLAIVQDAAKVSFEMGNSPKMVFEHYREIVTPEQANSWFGIMPGAAKLSG